MLMVNLHGSQVLPSGSGFTMVVFHLQGLKVKGVHEFIGRAMNLVVKSLGSGTRDT